MDNRAFRQLGQSFEECVWASLVMVFVLPARKRRHALQHVYTGVRLRFQILDLKIPLRLG